MHLSNNIDYEPDRFTVSAISSMLSTSLLADMQTVKIDFLTADGRNVFTEFMPAAEPLCRILIVVEALPETVASFPDSAQYDLVVLSSPESAAQNKGDNARFIVANQDVTVLGHSWLVELELAVSRLVTQRQQTRYASIKQMLATRRLQPENCSAKTFLLSCQSYLLLDGQLPAFQAARHQILSDLALLPSSERAAFQSLMLKVQQ